MPPAQQYQKLRRQLARRFKLLTETVTIGDTTVEITRPRSADELISPKDFEHDERLPYWAELWPSSVVLAARLPVSRGGDLLELGCGVGLVTALALSAHWEVLATDYYADALKFTELNALRIAGRLPVTRLVDWRKMPGAVGRFDAVVAADVLYEREYPALIASAIARTLALKGQAVIVDPGRVHAPAFTGACEAEGLTAVAEKQGAMTIYLVSHSSLQGPALTLFRRA